MMISAHESNHCGSAHMPTSLLPFSPERNLAQKIVELVKEFLIKRVKGPVAAVLGGSGGRGPGPAGLCPRPV